MREPLDISAEDAELVLSGGTAPGDGDVAALSGFLADVRSAFPVGSTEGLEERHLAAMRDAMGDLGAASGATATLPRDLLAVRRPPIRIRLAIAAAAAVLVFGALAYAGVLPAPLQDAASDAASAIGLDIPGSEDRLPELVPDPDESGADSLDPGGAQDLLPGDSDPAPVDEDAGQGADATTQREGPDGEADEAGSAESADDTRDAADDPAAPDPPETPGDAASEE